jgi:glycosyltransferase involved in cell wall biosynthesis
MVNRPARKGNTAIICLSPYSGGMEMDAIKLARLLCNDVQVTLFAKLDHYIAQYFKEHMAGGNVSLETVDFRSAFSLSIIRKTRKIIRYRKVENVIFFGASELRSLYFAFLGHNLNVIVRHGTTKTRSKKDWLHRLIYSCVNYHVAICQHLAGNVRYIIPFASNTQLKVIYPSLRSAPNLNRDREKTDIVRLLHIGRIADGKGQKEAIEACAILHERNMSFELICVGETDPGYEHDFNGYLDSKPYANSIQIVGYSDDVGSYYQQADIFIFPSKGEGLSNSFIEALSYGLVCICYDNTSFPELQQLGFSFYMAEDKNIEDLKNKLLEAVTQLESVELPMLEQSSLAQTVFSADRERDEYLNLLQ